MNKYTRLLSEIMNHPNFMSCSLQNRPLPGLWVGHEHTLTIEAYGDGVLHCIELKSNHLSSLVDKALNLFNLITADAVV